MNDEKFFKEVEEAIEKAEDLNEESLSLVREIQRIEGQYHFERAHLTNALQRFYTVVDAARAAEVERLAGEREVGVTYRLQDLEDLRRKAEKKADEVVITVDRDLLYTPGKFLNLRYSLPPIILSDEKPEVRARLEESLSKFFGHHKIRDLLVKIDEEIEAVNKPVEERISPLKKRIEELNEKRDAIYADLARLQSRLINILEKAGVR